MALYHKWDVKNDFAYVLQFFSLISDGLDGVSRTWYLPKAINGFDGQGHSGSHGSNNKNSNTHDPEYFSFGSIRPEDQFVNISGKHGRC